MSKDDMYYEEENLSPETQRQKEGGGMLGFMGALFAGAGAMVVLTALFVEASAGIKLALFAFALLFGGIGVALLIVSSQTKKEHNEIIEHGTLFKALVIQVFPRHTGVGEVYINGEPLMDAVIEYQNPLGETVRAQAQIPSQQRSIFVGMYVMCYELDGKFLIKRNSHLQLPENFKDTQPMSYQNVGRNTVGITVHKMTCECPWCGATFEGLTMTDNMCPYCGKFTGKQG